MTLSVHERAGRKRAEKYRRVKMLCRRLDRQVFEAEKYKKGRTRDLFLKLAEKTREELRKLDH